MGITSISVSLAHAGHAGDHGWLAGAAQPLLGVEHLLAGLFVASAVSVGLWYVARSLRGRQPSRREAMTDDRAS